MAYDPDATDKELAAFLRENMEEIVDALITDYKEQYPHSVGGEMPYEQAAGWSRFELNEVAEWLLTGEVDAEEYRNYWGDIITQAGPEFAHIAIFVEARFFQARVVIPIIWLKLSGDPDKARRLLARYERAVQKAIIANLTTFLGDEVLSPGGLLRSLRVAPKPTPLPTPPENARVLPAMQDVEQTNAVEDLLGQRANDDLSALSSREVEVLRLLAQGKANGEIAAALHITQNTVKHHISHILDKVQLANRTQLAVYAARQGLDRP